MKRTRDHEEWLASEICPLCGKPQSEHKVVEAYVEPGPDLPASETGLQDVWECPPVQTFTNPEILGEA